MGHVRALGDRTTGAEKRGRIFRRLVNEGRLVTEQQHRRYFAQELMPNQRENTREQIQKALDTGERKEWHLVGVSNVLPEGRVILFWDTSGPSFGRTSRR
jgi:hypothetical protein